MGKQFRMKLPVMPHVAPMLARAAEKIPRGDYLYEPKWDGFRSIVYRDQGEVEIGSRNGRSLSRYFPEVVDAVKLGLPDRCVIDGEIVVPDVSRGSLDFEALQQRIHPAASRVRMLAERTQAHFVAFDVLALGDTDFTVEPFSARRAVLEEIIAGGAHPQIHLTPATRDPEQAERWFHEFEGAGLDGIVAKSLDAVYQPDKRVMLKIKHVRTADCVVAGYRTYKGDAHSIGSLLLGLYDDSGALVSVGVVGAFTAQRRRALFEELQPLITTLEEHPWRWAEDTAVRTPQSAAQSRWAADKDLTFVPLRPERVVEVRYDHMEGDRFRHTAQFIRWRPERDPLSCTFEQLDVIVRFDLSDVLGAGTTQASPNGS